MGQTAAYSLTTMGNGMAYGINNSGVVVGSYRTKIDNRTYSYAWTSTGSGMNLLPFGGAKTVTDPAVDGRYWVLSGGASLWDSSYPNTWWYIANTQYDSQYDDMNSRGEIVGRTGSSAWLYADWGDGWKIHNLPKISSYAPGSVHTDFGAHALTENGYVTGAMYAADGELHAFLYRDGQTKDLGPGIGLDVNDSGQVLIINNGLPSTGWIYDDRSGNKRSMGSYGTIWPRAINRWGQVAGTQVNLSASPTLRAFLWENGTFYDISEATDQAGITLGMVAAINDRGQIVGGDPSEPAQSTAWMITPNAGTTGLYPQAATFLDKKAAKGQFDRAPTEKWYALFMSSGASASAPVTSYAPVDDHDLGVAQAYRYRAAEGSRFSGIMQFPQGFTAPFEVRVGDVLLGTFAPGDHLLFSDYASLLGSDFAQDGVREFTVTGVETTPELRSFVTFSLKLEFTNPTADFSMQARNTLIGDADGDGHVGYADFSILRDAYGQNGLSWYDGDFNLDGTIGPTDFVLLQSHVDLAMTEAQTSEITAFAASVPEPSGICLILLAALASTRRPARGRRDPLP